VRLSLKAELSTVALARPVVGGEVSTRSLGNDRIASAVQSAEDDETVFWIVLELLECLVCREVG